MKRFIYTNLALGLLLILMSGCSHKAADTVTPAAATGPAIAPQPGASAGTIKNIQNLPPDIRQKVQSQQQAQPH